MSFTGPLAGTRKAQIDASVGENGGRISGEIGKWGAGGLKQPGKMLRKHRKA